MKKHISVLMTLILVLGIMGTGFAKSGENGSVEVSLNGKMTTLPIVKVRIDGKEVEGDVPGVLYNGVTLVPVKFVSEGLGAEVSWKEEKKEVTVKQSGKEIVLSEEKAEIYVNKEKQTLGEKEIPKRMNDRIMVPLRFVSEVLGTTVTWDQETYSVDIETGKSSLKIKNNVNDVTLETIDGKEAIVIHNSSLPKYENSKLGNPNRILVDMQETKLKEEKTYELSNSVIDKVRTGSHPNNVSRVVIDLKGNIGNFDYEIREQGNNIVIFVTGQVVEVPMVPEENLGQVSPNGKTIVIDSGHGGKDPGAISYSKAYREKDLTLNAALKLRDELNSRGYNTVMTRSSDMFLNLGDIAEVANRINADGFISIHYNSAGASSATGIETWYTAPGSIKKTDDYGYAKSVQDSLINATGAYNRGVKKGNFAVTRRTQGYGILVELGFISNPNDEHWIASDEYQWITAKAMANGIDNFFK